MARNQRFKNWRENEKLKQSDIATAVNSKPANISYWETGNGSFPVDFLVACYYQYPNFPFLEIVFDRDPTQKEIENLSKIKEPETKYSNKTDFLNDEISILRKRVERIEKHLKLP